MTLHSTIAKRINAAIEELTSALVELRALADGSYTPTSATINTTEEYLSIKELALRIPYKEQTIRNLMSTREFREGEHFYRRRRRVIFRWSQIERWMQERQGIAGRSEPFIPVHHARTRQAR